MDVNGPARPDSDPASVVYHVFRADDSHLQESSATPNGIRLSTLRKLLKGDEGDVSDQQGVRYHISLRPWADADAEHTFILLEIPAVRTQRPPPSKQPESGSNPRQRYRLIIRILQPGDPGTLSVGARGYVIINGITLPEMRRRLGGDEGYIAGPDGSHYFVNLHSWKNADPETTFVQTIFLPQKQSGPPYA